MGNWFSDKYAEGTIGRRFYAGCQQRRHRRVARRRARPGAVRRRARVRPAALRHRRQPRRLLGGAGRTGSRPRPSQRTGVRQVNDLTESRLGEAAPATSATSGCSACRWTPAATSPTASGRTSPARCSTSAATAPTRRPACSTTTRCGETAREFQPLIIVGGYSAYPRKVNFRDHARDRRRGRRDLHGRHGALRRAWSPARSSPATSTRCRTPTSSPPPPTRRCAARAAAWCCASRSSPTRSTAAARWCSAARCRTSWPPRRSRSPRPAARRSATTPSGSSTTPPRSPRACCAAASSLVTGGTDNHLVL